MVIMKEFCDALTNTQKLHFSYHPKSYEMFGNTNNILKLKFIKLSEIFELPWPKILPLAFMAIHSTPRG